MKVGLVGFGSSGKSTVFSALSGAEVPSKGGLATTHVPDARVDRLAEMWQPKKTSYAEIVFEDYPTGSFSGGEQVISAAVLGDMRTLDVLAEVVDGFSGEGVDGAASRASAFHDELLLSDLAIVEKRVGRLAKDPGAPGEKEALEKCRVALEDGTELRQAGLDEGELGLLAGYRFLSLKPRLVVVNVSEEQASLSVESLSADIRARDTEPLVMCGPLEYELAQLDEGERGEFLADLGLSAGARDRFVASCYAMLDLITFLTAGDDEVRAWPLRRGSSAVEAAGKIHSDIARGFIRAEVIAYDDYIALGSEAACRQAGKLRTEGKAYIIADGDITHFRFNV